MLSKKINKKALIFSSALAGLQKMCSQQTSVPNIRPGRPIAWEQFHLCCPSMSCCCHTTSRQLLISTATWKLGRKTPEAVSAVKQLKLQPFFKSFYRIVLDLRNARLVSRISWLAGSLYIFGLCGSIYMYCGGQLCMLHFNRRFE